MRKFRSARVFGIFIASVMLLKWNPSDVAAQALIEYAENPSNVVVKFEELIGEIEGEDRGPRLEIYGDGGVFVYYPPYMKRAGLYRTQLAKGELDSLLQSLSAKQIPEFDAVEAKQRRDFSAAAQRAASATLFAESDPSTTVIELHLDRYAATWPPGQVAVAVHRQIAWTGLRGDAQRFPEVTAIQNLFAASQELRLLMEHPTLTKLHAGQEKP